MWELNFARYHFILRWSFSVCALLSSLLMSSCHVSTSKVEHKYLLWSELLAHQLFDMILFFLTRNNLKYLYKTNVWKKNPFLCSGEYCIQIWLQPYCLVQYEDSQLCSLYVLILQKTTKLIHKYWLSILFYRQLQQSFNSYLKLLIPRQRHALGEKAIQGVLAAKHHESVGMFVISDTLGGGHGLCLHSVNHSPLFLCVLTFDRWLENLYSVCRCKRTCFFCTGNLSSHNPWQCCDCSKRPYVQERTCGLEGGVRQSREDVGGMHRDRKRRNKIWQRKWNERNDSEQRSNKKIKKIKHGMGLQTSVVKTLVTILSYNLYRHLILMVSVLVEVRIHINNLTGTQ